MLKIIGSKTFLVNRRLIRLMTESSCTREKSPVSFLAISEATEDSALIIPRIMWGIMLSWVFLILLLKIFNKRLYNLFVISSWVRHKQSSFVLGFTSFYTRGIAYFQYV